ncbi:MAG TPA: lasso RiPP family leader peptide-containing protein [Acidimicrobiales bacterium]
MAEVLTVDGYEPPALQVLGTLSELTMGSGTGLVADVLLSVGSIVDVFVHIGIL